MGADELIELAVAATGLEHTGDDWFRGPLGAWADDLEQDNLTDAGRSFLRAQAVRDVARRLQVVDTLDRFPGIDDVALPPILYVTGMERSGTTLLHNLLARHRDARALLRWELMQPVPPPTAETYATDPRIAATQRSIDKLRGSLLERMHWVNADEPEECPWGFIDAVSMLGQSPMICMPTWAEHLAGDLTPAFENYRRLVKLLLWKHPVPDGGFLVLKAPQIARHLDEFARVFPEARFVVTHRDPFRCLTSMAVLGASIVAPFCVDNPLGEGGHRNEHMADAMISKFPAITRFDDREPERIHHVAYPSLIADPVGTVEGIFRFADAEPDPGLGANVAAYLEGQRRGGRRPPPPDLPATGFDHDEVLGRPVVADYCARFGVEPELDRLTGS